MILEARWQGIHQKVDIAGRRSSRLTVTEAAVGILPDQTSENRECRCQEVDRAGTRTKQSAVCKGLVKPSLGLMLRAKATSTRAARVL